MATHATPLRTTSVILVALVAGILTFAGVVIFLRLSGERELDPAVGRMLLAAFGLIAISEIPVYLLLRKQFLARARQAKDEALELLRRGLVPPPLFSLTIVGAAMAEGLGLLGVVAVLLGAPLYALAAPALAVALILAQIPTRERLEQAVRGG
jgi:hypothetical protein